MVGIPISYIFIGVAMLVIVLTAPNFFAMLVATLLGAFLAKLLVDWFFEKR